MGSNFYLTTQPLAVTRLYTTSTSFTVNTQNSLGLPTQVAITGIDVFIDGTYDQSIVVANSVSPFSPVAHTLTSAKLDGNPHLVEPGTGLTFRKTRRRLQGSSVSSIQDNSGNTLVYPAVVHVPNMLIVNGDSIGLGEGGGNARRRRRVPRRVRTPAVHTESVEWPRSVLAGSGRASRITSSTVRWSMPPRGR